MKAYGHSRRDKLTCKYGCCAGASNKHANCRPLVDASRRKTARQEGKFQILTELIAK